MPRIAGESYEPWRAVRAAGLALYHADTSEEINPAREARMTLPAAKAFFPSEKPIAAEDVLRLLRARDIVKRGLTGEGYQDPLEVAALSLGGCADGARARPGGRSDPDDGAVSRDRRPRGRRRTRSRRRTDDGRCDCVTAHPYSPENNETPAIAGAS